MVLIIDNYDSFTYNLVQRLGELGAEVQVYRNDQITIEEIDDLGPDRIIISPGPCTPREAGISDEVVRHFASPASPEDYMEYPIKTLKAGALGTHRTLSVAKRYNARYLLASTSEVYVDPNENPQKEEY